MTTTDDQRIGANLRQVRGARGMSQAALAEAARHRGLSGFRQSTVVKVEQGLRPLKLTEAVVLADVLGVQPTDLAALSATATHDAAIQGRVEELHRAGHQVTAAMGWVLSRHSSLERALRDARSGVSSSVGDAARAALTEHDPHAVLALLTEEVREHEQADAAGDQWIQHQDDMEAGK